jgi:glycosyltransferase involved in cell wall biosynthesis
MPEVSIIIPNFNSGKFINDLIQSLLVQSFRDWECIIVDDHSTDDSIKIIKEYTYLDNRIKLFERPHFLKKGANSCRNFGFKKSSGKYINWFDADDVMLENFLKIKVNSFYVYPNINFLITSGYTVNENLHKDSYRLKQYKTDGNLYRNYLKSEIPLITNSVMFKRNFIHFNSFFFNENLHKSQEYDLFSNIFYTAKPSDYLIIEQPTYLYRNNKNSSSFKNRIKYVKEYKHSQTYVLIKDLTRAINDNDLELVGRRHRLLMKMLKKSVDARDVENVSKIKNIYGKLYEKNKILIFSIQFFSTLFLFLKIEQIRWDVLLKYQKLEVN